MIGPITPGTVDGQMIVALYDDDGNPVTSLVASDLTDNTIKVQYSRDGGTWVDGPAATLKTLGATHVDGGIVNYSGNAGWLVDMPDATFAAGADVIAARLHPLPTTVAECSPGVRWMDARVSGVPAAVFDAAESVGPGLTLRKLLRGLAAVLLGKSSGNGTTYRDPADTKDVVDATVDADGNRTTVTTDLD